MADLKQIKEKINIFLEEFKNVNTPDEAIEVFKQIFDGEYYETFTDVDEPYYECHTQKLYLNNGYGIGIEKAWGPFDFAGGGVVSHEGEDLYIFSKLADKGINLFYSSEKEKTPNNISFLYNIDLSSQKILSVDDDLIFKFIPKNELENTEEMLIKRYEKLKRKAEFAHDNDVNNNLISYYGGLDVIVNPTEYYLYNSLLINKDNEDFMKIAIPLFNQDFPSYLGKEIEECKRALYIIDNKEKYYNLIELEENDDNYGRYEVDYQIDIEKLERQKEELQIKLNNALDELKDLKIKKYSIFDYFKGTKKTDAVKIKNIEQNVFFLKQQLSYKDVELKQERLNYENLKKDIRDNNKQRNAIKENLQYQYRNYSLNMDNEDYPYIHGEYFLKVSLDRLIPQKAYYEQKLRELEFMKSYENKEKNQNIELEKEDLDIEC